MIVVDTNILAYLWLPGDHTVAAERLLETDSAWIAPVLWRSEFRNVLMGYVRKGLTTLDHALQVQDKAEQQMRDREYIPHSSRVLSLASSSKCSAYDCEYVALAVDFGLLLFTTDKQILGEFPQVARAPG